MLDRGASALPQGRASGQPPSLPPISLESVAYALTLQASHMSERMISPMARVQSPEDIGVAWRVIPVPEPRLELGPRHLRERLRPVEPVGHVLGARLHLPRHVPLADVPLGHGQPHQVEQLLVFHSHSPFFFWLRKRLEFK